MNYSDFKQLKITSRYWLIGKAEENKDYYLTLRAFEVALKFHKGIRKDGITEEMYHQLSIFSYLRTMCALMEQPHIVLAVALLHDTYEDYPESHRLLYEEFPSIMPYIIRVSKVRDGQKISYEKYFNEMKNCPVTSIVKATDRLHNLSTMYGVFSSEKEKLYVDEVYTWFYPMIKNARREFPCQEAIYEILKSSISLLVRSIEDRS